MINLKSFLNKIKIDKKYTYLSLAIILATFLLFIFDKGLSIGFLLFYFLTAVTFFILYKFKKIDKKVCIIFLITFLFHIAAVLFLYFTKFQALGGGADFDGYNQNAIEIANRFSHGNFSLQGLFTVHYFPVLIGIIYMFTLPQMIVGQMFVVWLACISSVLLYFLSIEIGASKKSSFVVSLIPTIYPSYLYFGSLLLKDTAIVPLVLVCLLITIKILKKNTPLKFLLFFIALTGLIHFRFYIGFAAMFSFIICWFLLSVENKKNKLIYGVIMIIILGFSPLVSGYGYYGINPLKSFLNKDVITTYREVVYASPSETIQCDNNQEIDNSINAETGATVKELNLTDVKPANYKENSNLSCKKSGSGSSFLVKVGFDNPIKFIKNYFISFVSSIFGPFPWQLKYLRHIMFLSETFPLYIFLVLIINSVVAKIKKDGFKKLLELYKFTLPILIFFIIAMAALSLYINNFGIIFRIRIPIFISLLSVLALSLNFDNIFFEKLKKIIRIKL